MTETNQLKKFIVATGLLNHVWQSWNQFWRAYWLAHVVGGQDCHNKKIVPLQPNLDESQALWYLLTLAGKKPRGSTGNIRSSHQEITWGSFKLIQDLAVEISSPHNTVSNALSAASMFGTAVEHLQTVRNAQIHISMSNMNNLTSVTSSYVIVSKPKHPHEILEAREFSTGRIAIRAWVEDMSDFLMSL
ncbi:hypothetical protein ACQ4M3_11355 [Leptolyngbya sp. AN03gr2]|uniref:hypothetical protein n=1 Tax=unclassified Leptolyngbya TaxID=2650499 RepID=UPI003D3214F2